MSSMQSGSSGNFYCHTAANLKLPSNNEMIYQSFLAILVVTTWPRQTVCQAWNKTDNTKLAKPFRKRPGRGCISSQDTRVNTTKMILLQFFPEHCKPDIHKGYKNFGPLFWEKARAWNLNKTLEGA